MRLELLFIINNELSIKVSTITSLPEKTSCTVDCHHQPDSFLKSSLSRLQPQKFSERIHIRTA